MKKYILVIWIFIVYNIQTIGQSNFFQSSNVLLPTSFFIEYTVPLKPCFRVINDKCTDTVIRPLVFNNLQNNMIINIVKSALKGKTILYEPGSFYDVYRLYERRIRMDTIEFKKKLGYRVDTVFVSDVDGNSIKKASVKNYDLNEIFAMNFYEDWILTEKPFAMIKKVLGTRLIRKYYREEDREMNNPLFRPVLGTLDTLQKPNDIEKSNKRMILVNKVKYEHYLYADNFWLGAKENKVYSHRKAQENAGGYFLVSEYALYMNYVVVERLLNLLINKATKDNYPVYDFETGKKLTVEQIKSNLGYEETYVNISDVENGKIKKQKVIKEIQIQSIKSLIFHEEWYFDPETLRMQKKVVGISPVRYIYADDDYDLKKPILKPVFTIYFDESQKF